MKTIKLFAITLAILLAYVYLATPEAREAAPIQQADYSEVWIQSGEPGTITTSRY